MENLKRQNVLLFVFFGFFLSFCFYSSSHVRAQEILGAQQQPEQRILKAVQGRGAFRPQLLQKKDFEQQDNFFPTEHCVDEELGIRILCDPQWGVETDQDAVLLIVSQDPMVTLAITKMDGQIKTIQQLTRESLGKFNQYAEGFQVEEVQIAKTHGLKVKAFAKDYPDIRVTDYYVVHQEQLYGLLFTVDPKEEWDSYKFIVEQMVNSVEFIEPAVDNNEGTKKSEG